MVISMQVPIFAENVLAKVPVLVLVPVTDTFLNVPVPVQLHFRVKDRIRYR